MKRKILIQICALVLLITPSVYAQEVPPEEQIIIEEIFVAEDTSTEIVPEVVEPEIQPVEFFAETISFLEEIVATTTSETSTSTLEEIVATTTSETSTSTPTARVLIRNGADLLFEGDVEIGGDDMVIVDTDSVEHTISASSTLALLYRADKLTDTFDVSDIQYYSSFDALYLKCITVDEQKLCENWQYVINGLSPWSSVDTSFAADGDTVGFYFGSQYKIVFDESIYTVNSPVTAHAQTYVYQTDTWSPRTGVTVGVTIPDPLNPWTPLVLATYPVDENGEAVFTIATSGVYQIGIDEDYYYPTYSIEISSSTSNTATTTATSTGSTGGGSSGGRSFDVDAAISFLKSVQASNGSYGGSQLYSDWAAIAFAAAGESNDSLVSYMKSSAKVQNLLTDNERRVMALLALGEDPYDFKGVNYISAIVKEFDGTQFGETNLVNDDIFALIVLSKTGYESSDVEIKNTINFIISKQRSDGSWEGSADLTAAALQSLNQYKSVSGVSSSITKAKNYLKNSQQIDGGWNSIYSTSWVMQAMFALGEDWSKNGKYTDEYLAATQQKDGGVLLTNETSQNRIWATAYSIPAALEMSWDDILQSVSKPSTKNSNIEEDENSSSNTNDATTTKDIVIENIEEIATSTFAVATSTTIISEENIQETIMYTNNEKIVKDNSSENTFNSEDVPVENVPVQQLALITEVSWLKEWWIWIMGGIFAIGGLWGLKKII